MLIPVYNLDESKSTSVCELNTFQCIFKMAHSVFHKFHPDDLQSIIMFFHKSTPKSILAG